MIKLLWSVFIFMLLLSGCGWDGAASRHNDFVPLTSITVSAEYPTIAANTSTKLTVTGNFSGLYTRDITDQAVWSSNLPNVAGFFSDVAPNRVSGLVPGSATLTATVKGVSATFNLNVSSATISNLKISPVTPSLAKGLNTQFTVQGTFSDASVQDLTTDASWASSAPAVASVSNVSGSKGLANALAEGTATISATFDTVSDSTLLTVTAPVLQSLVISPASLSLLTGDSQNLKVTASFSDGSSQDVTADSDWTSATATVATVGNTTADKGVVKAVATGTTKITAVYGGQTSTVATVTVTAKLLESLALNHAGIFTFSSSDPVNFTATANYVGGGNQDVTSQTAWSSSAPNVASVDNTGKVTPVTRGTTILTASYGGKTQTVTIVY